MAAHAAPSARRAPAGRSPQAEGRPSPLLLGVPIMLGIGYGAFASFMARAGGAATFGQLWLALASGVAFAVVLAGLLRVQHLLRRELRAAAWGAFAGGAVGFVYSAAGPSVLRSSGIGLAIAVCTTLALFYLFYTHET